MIFRKRLYEGIMPLDGRTASVVVTLYEKGDKSIPSNYKPVMAHPLLSMATVTSLPRLILTPIA